MGTTSIPIDGAATSAVATLSRLLVSELRCGTGVDTAPVAGGDPRPYPRCCSIVSVYLFQPNECSYDAIAEFEKVIARSRSVALNAPRGRRPQVKTRLLANPIRRAGRANPISSTNTPAALIFYRVLRVLAAQHVDDQNRVL